MTNRSKVAVLWTKPESVIEDYERLFTLAGGQKALSSSATTILKDNISWHYPMPSANTTPWQLEGAILALQGAGFKDLVSVENQTVVTDPFKGDRLNGYVPIYQQYQIPLKYNFRTADMKWVAYRPKAKMLALDEIYPEGIRLPDYFIGKNIVHLPTVKCHLYTTTTGAMKNAFGGLLTKHRHYTHSRIHETLVDLLAIQKEIHPGIFAFMDGTTAGNGPGPRTMQPVEKNIILASADQVAIDAVAAKLMGFDPLSIQYIRLAHENGLGTGDVRQIELVGDDVTNENWGFKVGSSFHGFLAWMAWWGPTRVFQKIILRSPLVVFANMISYFNHDIAHWPFKEKYIYQDWLAHTQWGHLFQRYLEQGTIAARD